MRATLLLSLVGLQLGVQAQFADQEQLAWQNGAHSVVAADFDQDGDNDVAVAAAFADQVVWYRNDGFNVFVGPYYVSTQMDGARYLDAGDMDGDGDIDLVCALQTEDQFVWLENTEQGGQWWEHLISPVVQANMIKAADMDADGDLDVIGVSWWDPVIWFRNEGAGVFSEAIVISMDVSGPSHVWAADLDGDQDLDALVTSPGDDQIGWFRNNGTDGFGPWTLIDEYNYDPYAICAADMDGDGDTDVIVPGEDVDQTVRVFANDGNGSFALLSTGYGVPPAGGSYDFRTADVDEDGDIDIACALALAQRITYFLNDGTGHLGFEHVVTTYVDEPLGLYFADLNGDTAVDLLSASWDDGKVAYYTNLFPLFMQDDGRPTAPEALTLSPNPVKDETVLTWTGVAGGIRQVTMIDAAGRSIRTWNSASTRAVHIDREGLKAGVYTLVVVFGSAEIGRLRMVVE